MEKMAQDQKTVENDGGTSEEQSLDASRLADESAMLVGDVPGESLDRPETSRQEPVSVLEDDDWNGPVKFDNGQWSGTEELAAFQAENWDVPVQNDLLAASASSAACAPFILERDDQPSIYHLKWIKWKGAKTPIITQNENGPCPLIAIMNVLILKGRIQLPSMMEIITSNQLMEYLGDCIISSIPKNIPEGAQLNYEQNFQDAMSILPKLPKGLDVNVKFTGIGDFEYTPECIVFDLLHIPLYHGWLVEQFSPEATTIGSCSYNQLVDKIITNKTSPNSQLVAEAMTAEQFLEKSASQLTKFGLLELIRNLEEDELSVLFRNNHFITLYKHKNELFQLVTDQGFLTESSVVWETLQNIEGDGQFVDGDFVLVPPKPANSQNTNPQQQIDQDYLVALSLQEEQKVQVESSKEWEQFKHDSGMEGLTDEELAKRLQEEENRYSQRIPQEQEQQQTQSNQLAPQRIAMQAPNQNLNASSYRRAPNSPGDGENNGGNKSKSKNCTIV